jgi:hypothetical protein
MRLLLIFYFFLFTYECQAHGSDLSSLMIYKQNGKYFIAIKSSIAAFEGEVGYIFGKNSYKTPEEFQLLVIKHFRNNCYLIINRDTIRFHNPKVVLGHETTLFAELLNISNQLNAFYVRNTMFKDMPANICEVILSIDDHSQQQYILENANKHEIALLRKNNKWVINNSNRTVYNIIYVGVVSFVLLALAFLLRRRMFKVMAH